MINLPPEKMGSFFLGAIYENGKITEETVNYDARDLTTHAVCVGMTGSGKTGLCVGLLEEAAIDHVPAIIIDPKGDMTNLLLQFEGLTPEEFAPWINPDDASRKGMSVEDYTAKTAATWKKGLAGWGEGPERIKLLKDSVEYTIYTPGSDTGIPINILGSFAAPGIDFDSDAEMLRERIQGNVAALLGMINRKEDPSRSREGILLATLFEHHWRKGVDLDITSLILGIQNPPFNKLGVFDVDTFFPQNDRFQLAMEFNSLVASPQFSYWLKGDPLDIEKIYFTAEGKPRHSIFYIAHLSESERMFFVTLLLNSLIAWMRRQSGTTSLRSLLYFDEIFGYFPPTANPPSKKPLLTILKQARAFGVGAVLVTQNPVDIDYKGLANAGTWFIGKMQTERDKNRVLDGLKGAIAEAGASADLNFDDLISALDSRVFLLHNVHEDEPVVMHTRWVMSYLRGPLTRPQVKKLMENRKAKIPADKASTSSAQKTQPSHQKDASSVRPSLDPSIDQKFFAVWKSASEASLAPGMSDQLSIRYQPQGLAIGKVRFYDTKRGVDEIKEIAMLLPPPDDFGRVEWEATQKISQYQRKLMNDPDHPDNIAVEYADVPDTMNSAKELQAIEKEFSDYLYNHQSMAIHEHTKLKIYQQPGESIEAFQMRVNHAAREMRDDEVDSLQDKYEEKFDRLQDRIRREELKIDEQKAELQHRKTAEILGVAETIFSVFKGRRRSISSATTKSRMRRKASQRMQSLQIGIEELHEDYRELENELQEKLRDIQDKWETLAGGITKHEVKPRRTDVKVDDISLVWHPYWVSERGDKVSAI
jgi:hypothetical protein